MGNKIRFGVFGLGRGSYLASQIILAGGDVVAVCDYRPNAISEYIKNYPDNKDVKTFTDFDEFIKEDMDAVLICNYFCEHGKYSIKAMKAGKHVISETLPNISLAEGVELCRTKEETGKVYALLENYPFFKTNLEMKRLREEGSLGSIVYAEGEYIHPMNERVQNVLAPGKRHWRNWTPRTYYTTHALAPLMMITGATPTRVSAMASFHPEIAKGTALNTGDAAAVILCQTDTSTVFRAIGWGCFATEGSNYRICGTKGTVQNLGYEKLRLAYNYWTLPENVTEKITEYEAPWQDEELAKIGGNSSHYGGDFMVIYEFIKCLEDNREPFFNVYRSTTLASVAILAWRSVLNNNMAYDVPDFRKEEDRKKYEHDNVTPYPDEDYNVNFPCSSQPYGPTDEDIANANKYWEDSDFILN